MGQKEEKYDVCIIGAGFGGLLRWDRKKKNTMFV